MNKLALTKILMGIVAFCASLNTVALDESLDAYIVGDIIKIPLLVVGESQYRLDLQLIPDTNPVELKLIAADDITSLSLTSEGASTFSENLLTIPKLSAGSISYRIELSLVSVDPLVILRLSRAEELAPAPASTPAPAPASTPAPAPAPAPATVTSREKALTLYEESISSSIVQSKCVRCHVQGGSAGGSSLRFLRGTGDSVSANIAMFEALLNSRSNGKQYILGKVSGNGHGGGMQLPIGSAGYASLSEFLSLLSE